MAGLTPPQLQKNFGVFYESYAPSIVQVTRGEGSAKLVTISWNYPAVSGTSYRLYGSLSPTTKILIGEYPGSPITLKVPTSKIIIPEETPYHFWIAAVNGTTETFIEDAPAMVTTRDDKLVDMFTDYQQLPACNYNKATIPYEMLAFIRDEIRRRHVATMEISGEDFVLFKRRLEGTTCEHCLDPKTSRKIDPDATDFDPTVTTETENPRYQGSARCEICFGTGIVGGFYFPIDIKVGYLGFPSLKLQWKNRGVDVEAAPDAWTLWTPLVKQHDILYRKLTGEAFEVKDVKTASWKQAVSQQRMYFESLDADDMRARLTGTAIMSALSQYNLVEEYVPLFIVNSPTAQTNGDPYVNP